MRRTLIMAVTIEPKDDGHCRGCPYCRNVCGPLFDYDYCDLFREKLNGIGTTAARCEACVETEEVSKRATKMAGKTYHG